MCDSKNTILAPQKFNTTSKLLKHLHDIFDNYQSSKVLVWEIVRTMHPVHCAALLFILENVIKSNKAETLTYEKKEHKHDDELCTTESLDSQTERYKYKSTYQCGDSGTDNSKKFPKEKYCTTVPCATRPTLRLQRCVRDLNILPKISDTEIETSDGDGNLTIFGLVKIMQNDNKYDPSKYKHSELEIVVMHNLRTRGYAQFANNILNNLLPEAMQRDRYTVSARGTNGNLLADTCREDGLSVRFLQFYESIANCNNNNNDSCYYNTGQKIQCDATTMTTRESRTFRTMNRPRPIDAYTAPENLESDYYVQPRYVGYNVVVNSTTTETRAYNRYGELLQNLLYKKQINAHVTFEAVLLPLDERGNQRSWRYVRTGDKTNSGCGGILSAEHFVIIIVDVLRVNDVMLVDLPYKERMRYAQSLAKNTDNVTVAKTCSGSNATHLSTLLERKHHDDGFDMFSPINGIMYRKKTSVAKIPPVQYLFSQSVLYNFHKDKFDRIYGSCSLNVPFDSYFPLDMAETCTIVIVYAHDDDYYYTCVYDRVKFIFTHETLMDRTCDMWLKQIRYRNDLIYVSSAVIMPMGVAFMRVYHNYNQTHTLVGTDNRSKRVILGYEFKLTTSMYDVPYESCSWF